MTCLECEIKLGIGENASEHLAACEECRWLERELRLNASALHELRIRSHVHWEWAMAAAAAIVMLVFGWKITRVGKLPMSKVQVAAVHTVPVPFQHAVHTPAPRKKPRAKKRPVEAMKVKMLTSDPDVVIYWIVDK